MLGIPTSGFRKLDKVLGLGSLLFLAKIISHTKKSDGQFLGSGMSIFGSRFEIPIFGFPGWSIFGSGIRVPGSSFWGWSGFQFLDLRDVNFWMASRDPEFGFLGSGFDFWVRGPKFQKMVNFWIFGVGSNFWRPGSKK